MKDPFQGADWCRPVHRTPKISVMSGINVNFPNVMAPIHLQNPSISKYRAGYDVCVNVGLDIIYLSAFSQYSISYEGASSL